MSLSELKPRVVNSACPDAWMLIFLCPKCRKHEISVDFWPGEIGERDAMAADGSSFKVRVWTCSGRRVPAQGDDLYYDLTDISLFPSINREGCGDRCGGWHGFINHGAIK